MNKTVYRYEFKATVKQEDIAAGLVFSKLAVQCMHGFARTLMENAYKFDRERRVVEIDATNEVNRDFCRVFSGFAAWEFGTNAFVLKQSVIADLAAANQGVCACGRR